MELFRQNIIVTDEETGLISIGEEIAYIDFANEEIGIYVGTPGYDDSDGVLDLYNCKIEILSDEEIENAKRNRPFKNRV